MSRTISTVQERAINKLVDLGRGEQELQNRLRRAEECGPWSGESATEVFYQLSRLRDERDLYVAMFRRSYGEQALFDVVLEATLRSDQPLTL